jgi:hypothetical protein
MKNQLEMLGKGLYKAHRLEYRKVDRHEKLIDSLGRNGFVVDCCNVFDHAHTRKKRDLEFHPYHVCDNCLARLSVAARKAGWVFYVTGSEYFPASSICIQFFRKGRYSIS